MVFLKKSLVHRCRLHHHGPNPPRGFGGRHSRLGLCLLPDKLDRLETVVNDQGSRNDPIHSPIRKRRNRVLVAASDVSESGGGSGQPQKDRLGGQTLRSGREAFRSEQMPRNSEDSPTLEGPASRRHSFDETGSGRIIKFPFLSTCS